MSAIGLAKNGAPTWRNHDGMPPSPVAVGHSVSSIPEICDSVTCLKPRKHIHAWSKGLFVTFQICSFIYRSIWHICLCQYHPKCLQQLNQLQHHLQIHEYHLLLDRLLELELQKLDQKQDLKLWDMASFQLFCCVRFLEFCCTIFLSYDVNISSLKMLLSLVFPRSPIYRPAQ